MKRWIPRIIVLALVAGGVAFLWIAQPWAKGEPQVTFTTVPVAKGTIQAQVTANGTLSARTTVQVGAQVSGRIVELNADFNSKVKKGQVLAKLDEQLLKASIDQAQASYDLAVANQHKSEVAVMDTKRQLARQKTLQDQQLVAGATVEAAEVAYETAKAQVTASRASVSQAFANLASAKTNLTYATIYSPIDGIVLSRAVDVGQTVQASFSAPTLFTIAEDLARMQIDTSVAESDVGRLDQGVNVTFTVDAFPGKQFPGVVRQVRNAPTTTQGVVTYDAVIDVDNSEHALRPGMTANVTFVLASVADAIKIPNSVLRFKPTREQMKAIRERLGMGGGNGGSGRRHGGSGTEGGSDSGGGERGGGARGDRKKLNPDEKQLYKLVDGKPKMVKVKLGLSDGSSTQLVEGDIEVGDLLITEIQGLPADAKNQRKTGAF